MTGAAYVSGYTNEEHHHSCQSPGSVSTTSATDSEHSSIAISSTATTTTTPTTNTSAALVLQAEQPVNQPVMAATSSARPSLPCAATSLSSHDDFDAPDHYQDHDVNQRGLPQRPAPLINAPSIATYHHEVSFGSHRPTTSGPDMDQSPSHKRAASISIDDINKQARMQNLSLQTPGTSRFSVFPEAPDEHGELICLCTKAPKVPRPRNAFILYRQHHQASVAAQHPGLANPEISKLIGEQWREQPEEVRDSWKRLAEEEKLRHQRQYPDYRYRPRRGVKNAANSKSSIEGDEPGRCQKCGGRFIATPRTPSTPFSSAWTPTIARPMAAEMPLQGAAVGPGYVTPVPMLHSLKHRTVEADQVTRRGSHISMLSVDSHQRRLTQPYRMNVDEDYTVMSPTAPLRKRRRYNTEIIARHVSVSPPVGSSAHQHRQVSGPPVPAAGYVPGPLPRLPPYSKQSIHHQAHLQPPPRLGISCYPVQSGQEPRRGGLEFDESLRLPPLQAQTSKPSCNNSDASIMAATTTVQGTGLGIINAKTAPPPRQPSLALGQRPQWLHKLDMLRAISPPFNALAAGKTPSRPRGSIIALEGTSASVLREIAIVVEKALSVSGECAVKIWTNHEINFALGGTELGKSQEQDVSGLTGPVAKFQSSMLKWHRISEELVEYITSHPTPYGISYEVSGPMDMDRLSISPSKSSTKNTMSAFAPGLQQGSSRMKLPVAVLSTGYSLTVTDRYAASLHIPDAYRPDDHWRWIATMWRGIIGPDLTVYVQACAEDELRTGPVVEFANVGVLVVRVPAGEEELGSSGIVDEKLERRLGFEILEWVRGSQSDQTEV